MGLWVHIRDVVGKAAGRRRWPVRTRDSIKSAETGGLGGSAMPGKDAWSGVVDTLKGAIGPDARHRVVAVYPRRRKRRSAFHWSFAVAGLVLGGGVGTQLLLNRQQSPAGANPAGLSAFGTGLASSWRPSTRPTRASQSGRQPTTAPAGAIEVARATNPAYAPALRPVYAVARSAADVIEASVIAPVLAVRGISYGSYGGALARSDSISDQNPQQFIGVVPAAAKVGRDPPQAAYAGGEPHVRYGGATEAGGRPTAPSRRNRPIPLPPRTRRQ